MSDELWGLRPAEEGWRDWFAWRPVYACGRWRWLQRVQRRPFYPVGTLRRSHWEYLAGRAHDYPDSPEGQPMHFHTYACKHCGARFGI